MISRFGCCVMVILCRLLIVLFLFVGVCVVVRWGSCFLLLLILGVLVSVRLMFLLMLSWCELVSLFGFG